MACERILFYQFCRSSPKLHLCPKTHNATQRSVELDTTATPMTFRSAANAIRDATTPTKVPFLHQTAYLAEVGVHGNVRVGEIRSGEIEGAVRRKMRCPLSPLCTLPPQHPPQPFFPSRKLQPRQRARRMSRMCDQHLRGRHPLHIPHLLLTRSQGILWKRRDVNRTRRRILFLSTRNLPVREWRERMR